MSHLHDQIKETDSSKRLRDWKEGNAILFLFFQYFHNPYLNGGLGVSNVRVLSTYTINKIYLSFYFLLNCMDEQKECNVSIDLQACNIFWL